MIWCRQKIGDSRVHHLHDGPWTSVWQGRVCEDVKPALSQALTGVHKTSTWILSSPNGTHRFLAVLVWPLSTNRSRRLWVAKGSYSLPQPALLWRSARCTFFFQWLCLSYLICTHHTARFPLQVAQQLLNEEVQTQFCLIWSRSGTAYSLSASCSFLQHVISVAFDLQSIMVCNREFVAGSAGYKHALYLCTEHPLRIACNCSGLGFVIQVTLCSLQVPQCWALCELELIWLKPWTQVVAL